MLPVRPPHTTFSRPLIWPRRGRLGVAAAPRCVSAVATASAPETAAPPGSVSFPILGDHITEEARRHIHNLAHMTHVHVLPSTQARFQVNGCTGNMGLSVAEAAALRGLHLVPVSFSSREKVDRTIQVGQTEIQIYGPSAREDVLSSVIDEFPDVIIVDYTAPDSVNSNADLYCKLGLPFVMGTTGGNKQLLYKSVQDSKNYALISPQMGKQVVAFVVAMKIMAEQFPGPFSGYHLEVLESHQAGKRDTSGTAKDVIACFEKLGVSYDMNRMVKIRDHEQQLEMVGVPEEHIDGHAFHLYHLTSPDDSVSFEFQHNVCGRSIYTEGTIDAAIFLHRKVQSKNSKRIYDMDDVLREGCI